jgi:hypothetical protein
MNSNLFLRLSKKLLVKVLAVEESSKVFASLIVGSKLMPLSMREWNLMSTKDSLNNKGMMH